MRSILIQDTELMEIQLRALRSSINELYDKLGPNPQETLETFLELNKQVLEANRVQYMLDRHKTQIGVRKRRKVAK